MGLLQQRQPFCQSLLHIAKRINQLAYTQKSGQHVPKEALDTQSEEWKKKISANELLTEVPELPLPPPITT